MTFADVGTLGVSTSTVQTNERILGTFVYVPTRQAVRRQLKSLVADTSVYEIYSFYGVTFKNGSVSCSPESTVHVGALAVGADSRPSALVLIDTFRFIVRKMKS